MVALSLREQLISKILELDDVQAERVLQFVEESLHEPANTPGFSWGEWLKDTEPLLEELRQKYGDNHFDIVATLNEIREEESWLP